VRRFWTAVAVDPDGGIRLDDRPVRTPGRAPLRLPSAALAAAVAEEWRGVGDTLDPRAMPLTGLANAAVDRVAPDPGAFAAGLARYGESDLLCYRAADPPPLVQRQAAAWDPVLAGARGRFDVRLEVATGVMPTAQPAATVARLGEATAARSPWQLAALSPIVTVTGSLLLALALAEGAFDAGTVWQAANLDEDWQAEQWGQDPLAADARAARARDFDAGVRFLALL
jgi:chaperone required for assembly of F1-ATPase